MFRNFFSSISDYFYYKPSCTFIEHEKYNKVLHQLIEQHTDKQRAFLALKMSPYKPTVVKAARIIPISFPPKKQPTLINYNKPSFRIKFQYHKLRNGIDKQSYVLPKYSPLKLRQHHCIHQPSQWKN